MVSGRMIYGYARVSTNGQAKDGNSLEDQSSLILSRYSDAQIVPESYSGAKERPIFLDLIGKIQSGDTLVVTKLDRFCRATKEGLEYIDFLMNKGVRIHILNMGLIEDTPMGRLIVTNLLAFAEFERAMILERTSGGKAIARKKPNYKEGRPKLSISDSEFQKIFQKQKDGLITVSEAIKELGISRSSWYNLCRTV